MNAIIRTARRSSVPLLLVCLSPAVASAHPLVGTTDSLLSGLAHPLTGLDHLCAMIGVGLWAAQRGGRAIWLLPLAFVGVMSIGGLIGMAGIAMPMVESGIVASVLILGCLIAASVRLPLVASAALVGLFALFHGHAHGIEAPAVSDGLLYGLGFLASTALLHALGVALGLLTARPSSVWLTRYAGAAIAMCGVYLFVG